MRLSPCKLTAAAAFKFPRRPRGRVIAQDAGRREQILAIVTREITSVRSVLRGITRPADDRSSVMKHRLPTVAALVALTALPACARVGVSAQPPASASRRGATQPPPRQRKVPPGAKGFANYATRDASDKLATGAATRGGDVQALIDEGIERYQQNEFGRAAALFEQATRLAP